MLPAAAYRHAGGSVRPPVGGPAPTAPAPLRRDRDPDPVGAAGSGLGGRDRSAAQRLVPPCRQDPGPTGPGSGRRDQLSGGQPGRPSLCTRPTRSRVSLPASNMKLLTATAVLDRLGPAHRLITTVVAARPVRGVVAGNLYLVGGGDPLLRTAAYASHPRSGPDALHLARPAGPAGPRRRRDRGHGVGRRRREPLRPAADSADLGAVYTEEGDVGPLSALDVNDGFAPATASPITVGGLGPGPESGHLRDPGRAGRRHLHRPAARRRRPGGRPADHREGAGRCPRPHQHRQPPARRRGGCHADRERRHRGGAFHQGAGLPGDRSGHARPPASRPSGPIWRPTACRCPSWSATTGPGSTAATGSPAT